jgi:hypothetical protein
MKRSLLAAAAMLLAVTAAQAKASDYLMLNRKGTWTAYYIVSNMGNPMCGMQSSWGSSKQRIATAHVKYTSGSQIAVQLYKVGWRMRRARRSTSRLRSTIARTSLLWPYPA